MVASALALVMVVGIGVAAKTYLSHNSTNHNSTPAAARLQPPPKSWKLAFNASFTGDSLDSKLWDTCYPWALKGNGCTNYGNGDEREWYTAAQDRVSGGALHLVAQHEPTPGLTQKGTPKEYACRSGIVTSYPSFRFEYGLVQVTAKLPFSTGLWSALWLAAANQKWPPEVDIIEHWDAGTHSAVYLHPTTGPRQGGAVSAMTVSGDWHTFSLEWTKTQLTWYIDGTQVLSTTTGVPHQLMYLIMNLADTSTSGNACNGEMDVKSVKVWQP